jgi:hypothetical protein
MFFAAISPDDFGPEPCLPLSAICRIAKHKIHMFQSKLEHLAISRELFVSTACKLVSSAACAPEGAHEI